VSEDYGLKFPREFGLLLKQLLYFDRYTKLLAPSLNVLGDDRIRLGNRTSFGDYPFNSQRPRF
jgi:aarF domain-containing kinase